MKVSYKSLQQFFDTPLPSATEVANGIIFHAFEVEGLEQEGDDTIIDIKVLPDRAPSCTNELAIAREVGAIFNIPLKAGVVAENQSTQTLTISHNLITTRLGADISENEVMNIFTRLGFVPKLSDSNFICAIPAERVDLTLPENLLEEVGRLYGYDKIKGISLPEIPKAEDAASFITSQSVRAKLLPLGISEIYGYSFAERGDFEVLKPLQKDKPFLRTNLTDGLQAKLELNLKNVLFEDEAVKLFEIGTAFPKSGEELRVAVGIAYTKKKFNKSAEAINHALKELGVEISTVTKTELETMTIVEFTLTKVVAEKAGDLNEYLHPNIRYQKFSLFPRITRDIALFVPEGTDPEVVVEVIHKNSGELLVHGPVLFDEFHKDGKVSLAFRLVFQAFDRTLSDNEINPIVDTIITALEQTPTWQVRR